MESEFEKLVRNSRPDTPPALKKSVLDAAKAEWPENDVEQKLESARVAQPSAELRQQILNAARSAWNTQIPPISFKRWLLATAAVVLFATCVSWFDNHQNASLQAMIQSGDIPRYKDQRRIERLVRMPDFGMGKVFLLGGQTVSSIDTPKKEIAWRYIQATELKE